MPDLADRFRSFSRTRTPDLWSEIETREPRFEAPPTPSWHRGLAAAVALVVAVAGIGLAAVTFGGSEPATGTSGTPAGPKANGEIWFRVGGGDGGSRIESVAPDGSGKRVVFEGEPTRVAQVAWSPDGTKIAYQDPIVDERGIFVANADGTDPVRLTRGVNDAWPSWSPNGTRIVFSSTRYDPEIGACTPGDDAHCPTDLFIVNVDGSNVVRLTVGPSNAYQAAWSPTGDEIAFTKSAGYTAAAPSIIAVTSVDGSDDRDVSTGNGGSDFQPSWSPDGSQIAFAAIREDDWGVWAVEADGSGERRILGGDEMGYVDDPVWSPDASLIAFVGNPTVDDYSPDDALYVMRTDGTDVTKLADAPGIGVAGDIAWQPIPGDAGPTPSPDALIPTSAEVETFKVGEDVRSVVYGDGSVWVAASNNDGTFAGRILRVDPDTHQVEAEIAVGVIPTWEVGGGAMVVAEGNLCITGGLEASGSDGPSAGVVCIDTSTNEVLRTTRLGDSEFGADLAFLNGDLWVMVFRDKAVDHRMAISRLDPLTGEVLTTIPIDATYGHRLFAVGDRIVAVTNETNGSTVGSTVLHMIDPVTATETATMPLHTYAFIGIGDIGSGLWQVGGDGLMELDPATGRVIAAYPDVRNTGTLVTAGGGAVWFASAEEPARAYRFNPSLRDVDLTVRLPGGTTPIDMAVAPNAVWILNYEGTLTHVELH